MPGTERIKVGLLREYEMRAFSPIPRHDARHFQMTITE